MSAVLRGVITRAGPSFRPAITQKASMWGSGPPAVRISFAEKVVSGVVLSAAILAPLGYLLTNVKNYRARPGQDA